VDPPLIAFFWGPQKELWIRGKDRCDIGPRKLKDISGKTIHPGKIEVSLYFKFFLTPAPIP
jgi:hypothetical protein